MTTPQQAPPPEIDDLSRTIGAIQEGQRQHDHRFDRVDDSLQEIRQELRATNTRIDHLTLAVIAIGGGIIATGIGIIITLALT